MTDSESPTREAFEFEKYLIPNPKQEDVPAKAWELYQDGLDHLEPVNIAKHPEKGFAVLGSFGQGPMIIWREPTAVDLLNSLIKTIAKLDWAVALPEVQDDAPIPGMIIGTEHYVDSVLSYLPKDFSKKFLRNVGGSMYEVEKNVQVPDRRYSARIKYPFEKLEVGDSFFVPFSEIVATNPDHAMRSAARSHSKRHPPKKFTVRHILADSEKGTSEGYRFWRVV